MIITLVKFKITLFTYFTLLWLDTEQLEKLQIKYEIKKIMSCFVKGRKIFIFLTKYYILAVKELSYIAPQEENNKCGTVLLFMLHFMNTVRLVASEKIIVRLF